MSNARLKILLDELATRQQIETPEFDEQGHCRLMFDEQFEILLTEKFDFVFLHAELGALPQGKELETGLLKDVLRYSAAQALAKDVAVSLDGEGKMVLFKRETIKDITIQQFEDTIEDFANVLETYWKFLTASLGQRTAHLTAARPNIVTP